MKHHSAKAFLLATIMPAVMTTNAAKAEDFRIVAPTEAAMSVADGVVTARLNAGGCDAGFEPACTPMRQRAEYQSPGGHGHGDRVLYRWEVNVPRDNVLNAVDNHLYAVRFLAGESAVLQFIVGNDYGYEVNRKTCFGPEGFGEWHQVEVRVAWDSTRRKGLKDVTPGEIHISCDGVEVFSKSGRPNIKADDVVTIAFGLEGALKLAEGDKVSVSYRNIEIGTW